MSDLERRRASGLTALNEGLIIAWEALRANKLRSSLTILGVAVGVSVVVAMAALITGIRTSVMSAFESAGPNNFVVTRFDFTQVRSGEEGNNRPPWWDKPEIEPEEAERIAALPGIDEALYNFGFSVSIDFEGQRVGNVNSQGYSAGWPRYSQGDFIAGRDFTPGEVRQNRALVVISAELALELFGQRDPIGRRVRVENVFRGTQEAFTVVGVYQQEPNIFSSAVKHFAIFPHTAAERRLRQNAWQAQILVVPKDSVSMSQAQDAVIAALRAMRGLGPRDENNFALLSSAQIVDLFNRLTAVFFLVMLALSSAGLLVGGVGVIGIMLISVTERTREIGIRKAVGATRREILWQFLVEASVLTALGAVAGMLAGWGLAEAVAAWTPLPARIPIWAVGAALGMAILTGMLFGLFPAHRAARMDPVVALRYE
ncbi:MAG TPA: ABC transporter permease [Longimicrobiales bacterium]|nr:ABC transporter permease [Longimicrobiales bacterium]